MTLKHTQIINFHDDEELQSHVSITAIEMIIKTKQMFLFLAESYEASWVGSSSSFAF